MREGCDSLECAIRLIVVQRTEAEPRMDSTAIVHLFLFFETLSFAVALFLSPSLSLPSFSVVSTLGWRGTLPQRECLSLLFLIVIAVPPSDLETSPGFLVNRRLSSFIPLYSISLCLNQIKNYEYFDDGPSIDESWSFFNEKLKMRKGWWWWW